MEENETKQSRRGGKIFAFIIFPVILIAGAVALYFYLQYQRAHISTDDAFVDGRVHVIASKVPGTVKALHVVDNQQVKKGDPILDIDPIDYDVRMNEAQAALEAERSRLNELQNRVGTAQKQLKEAVSSLAATQADLELQKANLRQAEADFKRAETLWKGEIVSREEYDRAHTTLDASKAQVKAAEGHVKQLEATVETQKAVIKQNESALLPQRALIEERSATLKQAELNKSYTIIYAPADGYITKRSVEVGNQIQTDQGLMAVVPLDSGDIWVTANYKETQLKRVIPGQRVIIKVDAYPDKVFYGRVDSIMAGTGSIFSLFPPENAAGNYVKVVQRIPVKITLEKGADPQHLLRIGMSVVPTILAESK
jgi:membrane fusion protein, multidrug efflux system